MRLPCSILANQAWKAAHFFASKIVSHQSELIHDEQRTELEAISRRRKVEAHMWKRARTFLLLDAGENAQTVCRILDIDPTVLTEWRFVFATAGLSFFGLKDYSQRQGHLNAKQEQKLKTHFIDHYVRNVDEVCDYISKHYAQNHSAQGAAKLMRRLGFEYKKPVLLPAQADKVKRKRRFRTVYLRYCHGKSCSIWLCLCPFTIAVITAVK